MSAANTEPVEPSTRRHVLAWLAGGTLGLTALAALRAGTRFMTPPLTTQPSAPAVVSAADTPPVNLGVYVPQARAYLMCDAQGYFAVSATARTWAAWSSRAATGCTAPATAATMTATATSLPVRQHAPSHTSPSPGVKMGTWSSIRITRSILLVRLSSLLT